MIVGRRREALRDDENAVAVVAVDFRPGIDGGVEVFVVVSPRRELLPSYCESRAFRCWSKEYWPRWEIATWMRLMPVPHSRSKRGRIARDDERLVRLNHRVGRKGGRPLAVGRVAELPAADVDGRAAGIIRSRPIRARYRAWPTYRDQSLRVVHDLADDHLGRGRMTQ